MRRFNSYLLQTQTAVLQREFSLRLLQMISPVSLKLEAERGKRRKGERKDQAFPYNYSAHMISLVDCLVIERIVDV